MLMSDQEIEFNDFFKQEGGIYRGNIVEKLQFHSMLIYADKLINKLKEADDAVELDIYVDVINDFSLNACAGKKGKRYFIGINIGVLVLLSNILFRMFSSNSVLAEIGDISKEKDTRKIYDAQIRNIQKLLDDFNEDLTPKDETRLAAGSFFFKSILEFLMFHEYAHIISGHIDYYSATKGVFKLYEIQSDFHSSCEDPIFQQTIELLADDFAVFGCMRFLHHTQLGEMPINPLLKPYFNDWRSTLQFWYLPIYTFFRIFGHLNHPHLLKLGHHPMPAIRSHLVLESIDHFLDNYFNVPNHEEVSLSCIESVFKIEDALGKVSEQGKDLRPLKYILTEEVSNYTKILMNKKDDVNNILKKHAPIV
jgi:hypothetical protein